MGGLEAAHLAAIAGITAAIGIEGQVRQLQDNRSN